MNKRMMFLGVILLTSSLMAHAGTPEKDGWFQRFKAFFQSSCKRKQNEKIANLQKAISDVRQKNEDVEKEIEEINKIQVERSQLGGRE